MISSRGVCKKDKRHIYNKMLININFKITLAI